MPNESDKTNQPFSHETFLCSIQSAPLEKLVSLFPFHARPGSRSAYKFFRHAVLYGRDDVIRWLFKDKSRLALPLCDRHYFNYHHDTNPLDSSPAANYMFVSLHSRQTLNAKSQVVRVNVATGQMKRFMIGSRLGSGTFGLVYRYKAPGEQVLAVKTSSSGWVNVRKFAAKMRAAIREYNMLTAAYPDDAPFALEEIRRIGRDGKPEYRYNLIMPYIAGCRFTAGMRAYGHTPANAARIILQTATHVAALHQKNIVHRDLTYRNVLVAEEGVKLIDFGEAKHAGELAPVYLHNVGDQYAPESIKGFGVDDLFSTKKSIDAYMLARTIEIGLLAIHMSGSDESARLQSLNTPGLKDFFRRYPSVRRFLAESLVDDEAKRPPVSDLVDALTLDIARKACMADVRQFARQSLFAVPQPVDGELLNEVQCEQSGAKRIA